MGKVISFKEFEAEKHLKQFTYFYDAYLDLVDHLEFSEINLYKHTNIQDIKLLKPATKKNLIHSYNAYNHMHAKYPKSYPRDDVWGLLALAHFQDLKKLSKLTPKEKVKLIKKEQSRNLKEAWGSKGKMAKYLRTIILMTIKAIPFKRKQFDLMSKKLKGLKK